MQFAADPAQTGLQYPVTIKIPIGPTQPPPRGPIRIQEVQDDQGAHVAAGKGGKQKSGQYPQIHFIG